MTARLVLTASRPLNCWGAGAIEPIRKRETETPPLTGVPAAGLRPVGAALAPTALAALIHVQAHAA